MRRLGIVLAVLLLSACGSGGSSGGSTSGPDPVPTVDATDLWVTDPQSTTFQADPGVQQPVLEGSFEAESGQVRVVAALLAPTDPSARIFMGQQVGCVGPSGSITKTPVAGRNVFGTGPQVPILSALILTTDEAGTWTCGSTTNVCVPGSCKDAGPDGTVHILTRADTPTGYSVLAASTALPDWSQQVRPGDGDLAIPGGSSASWHARVSLPAEATKAGMAGTISMTNCITPTFPSACADAPPHDTQGKTVVKPTVTLTQLAQDGSACQSYTLTEKDGVYSPMQISWEEHHTQMVFIVRELVPSTDDACTREFDVALDFEVTRGNGLVVERGTAQAPRSLVVVTPPLPSLILSE